MNELSVIRSVATGSIAAGAAALCWFNLLPKEDQAKAERDARKYGQLLLDRIREHFHGDDPPPPSLALV